MRFGLLAALLFDGALLVFAFREFVAADLLPPGRAFRDIMPAGLVLRGFAPWRLALRAFVLRCGLLFIFDGFDFVTFDFLLLAMVRFPVGRSNG
jgi:hypothetical protein